TLIGSLGGGKKGKLIYDYMIDNCHISYVDGDISNKSLEKFLKYDGTLSFADSVSLELMETFEIKKIASFDSDFDKVKIIQRIH
ncbi:MAG TPA: type II toxin-antitoxin system VapC family toxin, partial [Methanobacterium sp.]